MKRSIIVIGILSLCYLSFARNMCWQDSIRIMEDAVRKSPNETRALMNLSHAYISAGLADKAFDTIQRIFKVYPEPGAFYLLGRVQAMKGNPAEAVALYEEAVRRAEFDSPTSRIKELVKKSSFFGAGNAETGRENYSRAEQYYRKVVDIDPEHALAWNNLGYALYKQKRCKEAVRALETALQLMPDDPLVLENLELSNNCMKGSGLGPQYIHWQGRDA